MVGKPGHSPILLQNRNGTGGQAGLTESRLEAIAVALQFPLQSLKPHAKAAIADPQNDELVALFDRLEQEDREILLKFARILFSKSGRSDDLSDH